MQMSLETILEKINIQKPIMGWMSHMSQMLQL